MKSKFLNIGISIVSILLMLLVMEVAARIYKSEYSFKNFLDEKSMFFRSAYPAEFDPELLGWIPKKSVSNKENVWGTTLEILENGIRSNGRDSTPPGLYDSVPVLVVGGSFTFGDQVSDHETFPAILEKMLQKRVINAGVFGYGTDQSFLRAKKLIDIYKPDILIMDVMYDHVMRAEQSVRRGVGKPYFEASGGKLILKNIPVPPPSQEQAILGKFRKVLGHSFFIHILMMRINPEYWLQGIWNDTTEHSDGVKVTCLIFKELMDIAKTKNIKVYILLQYHDMTSQIHEVPLPEMLETMGQLKTCLKGTSLTVVDLWPSLLELKENNEEEYKSLYKGHMTAKGNAFVAAKLKEAMGL